MEITPLALVVLVGFGLILSVCLLTWTLLGSRAVRSWSDGSVDEPGGETSDRRGAEARPVRSVASAGRSVSDQGDSHPTAGSGSRVGVNTARGGGSRVGGGTRGEPTPRRSQEAAGVAPAAQREQVQTRGLGRERPLGSKSSEGARVQLPLDEQQLGSVRERSASRWDPVDGSTARGEGAERTDGGRQRGVRRVTVRRHDEDSGSDTERSKSERPRDDRIARRDDDAEEDAFERFLRSKDDFDMS